MGEEVLNRARDDAKAAALGFGVGVKHVNAVLSHHRVRLACARLATVRGSDKRVPKQVVKISGRGSCVHCFSVAVLAEEQSPCGPACVQQAWRAQGAGCQFSTCNQWL